MKFKIEKELPNALGRAGVLETPHGEIHTPSFVTVGTKATVKALTPEEVKNAGAQVVLANTYHLYLEPGEKLIKESGGLHKFMNWNGPTMTDSGGFQAFSLGVAYGNNLNKFIASEVPDQIEIEEAYAEDKEKKAKITEDGVEFKSIIDGSTHFFSPEKSIQIQNDLGADIIFAFDECTSPHASKEYLKMATERTHRWAERCLDAHRKFLPSPVFTRPAKPWRSGGRGVGGEVSLFGIVQGGRHEDLRKESARVIGQMEFDGFGIGGSFVKEDMANAVKWVNEILPKEKPRHLLGVGEPEDLFLAVENGCDLFDCVAPTRMARNGTVHTKNGRLSLFNAKFRDDLTPIDSSCACYACQNYTRAYVSHLFRAKEILAATLASIHNLYFIINMVSRMREEILADNFPYYKEDFLRKYYNR